MGKRIQAQTTVQQPLFRTNGSPKEAFRTIRNFLAGQFVGATRDDVLLEEVIKCLFCKLLIERGGNSEPLASNDPIVVASHVRSLFSVVRKEFPDIYEASTELLLDPVSISFVINSLDFSVMDPAHDPVGDAFEAFVGSESRGNSGQFFSPRSATRLLADALDPKPGESILDPACGAGGFLTAVCARWTENGLSNKDLQKAISGNFWGIDKDSYLAKLAKMHVALLTGAHPNVICGDSLAMQYEGGDLGSILPRDGVDVLLTNPPFGVKIVAASQEVMQKFQLARKWSKDKKTGILAPSSIVSKNVPPQVLFVERCLSLLKPGGRLGIVLPESLLSNKSYRHVVSFLRDQAEIHGVMGMPDALFKTSGKGGTHTKTCLLVATKKEGKTNRRETIFMAEAKWCGQDSRARSIPHNDLPSIAKNFNRFEHGKLTTSDSLGFTIDDRNIVDQILCPRYYDPMAGSELDALTGDYNLLVFKDLKDKGIISISTGDEIGKLSYGTGDIPFIRTSDISNWELKTDHKHGVSRDIYNKLKQKQDVKTGDILMVRDGTYLIGTCAIVAENEHEMLYQSHLYKIRLITNEYGLDNYLLLAILSSPSVQKQIRSKQFTQDIIDSLGDRIGELVLPVPKDKAKCREISELVRGSVIKRTEAKNLSKKARELIG